MSKPSSEELRRKRAGLINEARDMLDVAQRDADGKLSAEQEERYDRIMAEVDDLAEQIKRVDREARQADLEREMEQSIAAPNKPDVGTNRTEAAMLERRAAFRKFLRGGLKALTASEERALAADSPAAGGFLVAPQQFVTDLLAAVKDQVAIRQLATVMQVERAASLGVPTLDADPADADWTSELGTGSEDSTMAFGKRELNPQPIAKRLKVSNKLLRSSALDVDAIVRDRLAYKFAVTEEKAFLTGNGANQPLGVFTASAAGISTGRDTIAASATAIAGDDLINVKHDLKPQYWTRASVRWVFHRDFLKRVRQLKDTTNNYLWAPGLGPGGGLTGGNPPTILDIPYIVSEYAPNTFTAGLYTAVLGDFSFYWIADALDMQVQVLDQLYAETNQTGYIGRREVDGMPVMEEAFRRLRML